MSADTGEEQVEVEVEVEEEVEVEGFKLVIRGLPYEATSELVCDFFDIEDESRLKLITWSDSGRCKGHAYVTCATQEEVEAIKSKNDAEFTADENTRLLKISDFNPNNKQRKKKNTRKQRDENETPRPPRTFEPDDDSLREVYVSNVPFQAGREDFERVFGDSGEIEEITIPKIYNSGRPKGFAFVRFKTEEGKDNALLLNSTLMHSREISVRPNKGRAIGGRPRQSRPARTGLSRKAPGCSTIFVGNLPWDAVEKDLEDLFKDCGEIKNARIVRQSWTDKSRGFGYVEFTEEASVDTAVQKNIVLQERPLRIDFADPIGKN